MHAASSVSPGLRLAVTGSSGFIGDAAVRSLRLQGHDVRRVRRGRPGTGDTPAWDPSSPDQADPRLEGLDGLIHCAGAGIADRRWTSARKAVLRSSRVDASRNLSAAIARLRRPPAAFVQCAAIGWYGDQGDRWLVESDPKGSGFLADLCADWEHAAAGLDHLGVRRVVLRLGMVIGPGGAVAKMAPLFRRGLGGRLGDGSQWISWIALPDVVEVIRRSVTDPRLTGPVNAVTPEPITNRDFTAALAAAFSRRAWLPAPAPALRCLAGGLAREVLLASQRCRAHALQAVGFQYQSPDLPETLKMAAIDLSRGICPRRGFAERN
ncbi:MAG: TIGR01777 family oxidoreductase [Phycisphaerales bacterium]|jgi:hypothetical protein|nr:TIGR01777 family oxidoreductase [Phycisphaerales bacterium]